MKILSTESLDSAVGECVRLKLEHATLKTNLETQVAALQKTFAGQMGRIQDRISESEERIRAYCTANREELFPVNKSRDSLTAVYGFELTPWRVATHRKINWKEVVRRLQSLTWGGAYVRHPEPQPDKLALLADRERLTPVQQNAAGIEFQQDEQFFIRPKAESAEPVAMMML